MIDIKEEIFYEGGPAKGDLIINLLAGLTLLGLPLVLRSFLYMGRFPMDSFSFSLRIFFSTVIPITFITTIPSEVLLGLSPVWKIILEVLVSMTFLIFSRRFWKFALKFYTSASS